MSSIQSALSSTPRCHPDATDGRVAMSLSSFYRPYRSKLSATADVTTWVQIDLGVSHSIEAVRLYPVSTTLLAPGDGFPTRFRIECSGDGAFTSPHVIADQTVADYTHPGDHVVQFGASNAAGRYVRLTVTRLRARFPSPLVEYFPEPMQKAYSDAIQTGAVLVFALSKIEVLSDGIDLALNRPVSVDPAYGNADDAQQLTRSPRPQGEDIVTDNPQNITSPDAWRPVPNRAQLPASRVRLGGGLFSTAVENNISYLLESFSVDDLLRPFRERAGKPIGEPTRKPHPLWDVCLPGSNAGRFLMGAGKTLQWIEHEELRTRVDAIVEGIADCSQANGYIMAYPEDTFFDFDRGAYTRAWVTHGLIEAGCAGREEAYQLLRSYHDWYNEMEHLPLALRGCLLGQQGMVANSRMYFTPVGRTNDIHVLERYFQENHWLDDLAARRVDALWQYPYERPHAYLLTTLEAYLDLYRATGDERYFGAVSGAWELIRANWQYIGGSIALIEADDCRPKSYPLYSLRGETCASAFWILLNQRLHLLDPEEEKYVAEIEKSIYNVLLANQSGRDGIRYHTRLVGRKTSPTRIGTCCEGQGTRVLAALPEYIYSTDAEGIYVNLFEPSSISWEQGAATLQLEMEAAFPSRRDVRLTIHAARPARAKIRVRTPSWASGVMEILVNRLQSATGTPGSYALLDRLWSDGDEISFTLPIAFRQTRYTGIDEIKGRERYWLEYGPILMAAVDAAETPLILHEQARPSDLATVLQPSGENALHFGAAALDCVFLPYFEVEAQHFSCVPVVHARRLLT